MRIFLVLIGITMLSGCALVPYVPPKTGPTAKIKFKNESSGNLRISFFAKSEGCVGRQVNKTIQGLSDATYVVRAQQNISFEYYYTQGQQYCLLNLEYQPETDHSYLFRTITKGGQCKWVMFDDTQKTKPSLVKLKRKTWERGFDEGSSWCSK